MLSGNLDTAQRQHRGVLDDVRDDTLPWVQSMAGLGLAAIARRRGDLAEAERRVARAWQLASARAVPLMRALVLVARAYTADLGGNHDDALNAARAALEITLPLHAPRQ